MQKFWITNGVPRSIKFDPNFTFSMEQPFTCLLINFFPSNPGTFFIIAWRALSERAWIRIHYLSQDPHQLEGIPKILALVYPCDDWCTCPARVVGVLAYKSPLLELSRPWGSHWMISLKFECIYRGVCKPPYLDFVRSLKFDCNKKHMII